MCSGAIVNSRIKNIIIGTKHIKNKKMEKQHEFKMDYYKDNNIQCNLWYTTRRVFAYFTKIL